MTITAHWAAVVCWMLWTHLIPTLFIVLGISVIITHFLPRKIPFFGLMPGILFCGILVGLYLLPYIIICGFVWFLIMVLMDYGDD